MKCSVIILAAGQGSRMRSAQPKVLHKVANRTLLHHVFVAAHGLNPDKTIIVYGHGGEQVLAHQPPLDAIWVEQAEQLGTGHAVAQAMPDIDDSHKLLILLGDAPLISTEILQTLIQPSNQDCLSLLTVDLENAEGYGRIIRNAENSVQAIVEHKDADATQRQIREVNTGMMCVPAKRLRGWLQQLKNSNAQGEYYLTDIIAMAVADGVKIEAVKASNPQQVEGVNDRLQLASLERYYQSMKAEELMKQGVTLRDPARIDIRGEVSCGQDVVLDINVILEGKVTLGDNVLVGPNSIIRNSSIGAGTVIEANCVIENAEVENNCSIGPFARLRPGAHLMNGAKAGNFVEIKNAEIGEGSKVNHLSYIGDAILGKGVNIGAGTITCNYDGANKHKTIIGDNAFIGSNSQLVAPVTIGHGATIGAGTTLTTNAEDEALTLTRSKQKTISNWTRPVKTKK